MADKSYANLYWVTTEGDDEDWFIIARSAREAREYHVETEGYDWIVGQRRN